MKSWLIAPLFLLQPVAAQEVEQPQPNCFNLPAEQRAACEARETPPPLPIPPGKESAPVPPQGEPYNDVHMSWGYEFTSPYTFSDKDEGTPAY